MSGLAGEPTRRGAGLAGRLLVAQTLVLLTGGLTAWTIAAIVGPSLFHNHLASANVGATPAQILHTEKAYQSANAISLSLALLAALVVAMAVNVYIARRMGRSVATIADAASDVAGGHYDIRVPSPGLGANFDALASGFHQMADELGSVERTRRRLLSDLGHEMRTSVATLEAYLEGAGGRRCDAGCGDRGAPSLPDLASGPVVRRHRHRLQDGGGAGSPGSAHRAPRVGDICGGRLGHRGRRDQGRSTGHRCSQRAARAVTGSGTGRTGPGQPAG